MERPSLPLDQTRCRGGCTQPFIGETAPNLEVTFIILQSVEDLQIFLCHLGIGSTDKAPLEVLSFQVMGELWSGLTVCQRGRCAG